MQNIDFLSKLPKSSSLFTALHFFLICGGFTLLLAIISGVKFTQYGLKHRELTKLRNEREVAVKELQTVALQSPIIYREKDLAKSVGDLSQHLSRRIAVYKALTKSELVQGFSTYLYALSQYVPGSVSLKNIYISQKDENIVLLGDAATPVSVSVMVKALKKDPLFKLHHFNEYEIQENKETVQFQLATKSFHYELEKDEEKTVDDEDSEESSGDEGTVEKVNDEKAKLPVMDVLEKLLK